MFVSFGTSSAVPKFGLRNDATRGEAARRSISPALGLGEKATWQDIDQALCKVAAGELGLDKTKNWTLAELTDALLKKAPLQEIQTTFWQLVRPVVDQAATSPRIDWFTVRTTIERERRTQRQMRRVTDSLALLGASTGCPPKVDFR